MFLGYNKPILKKHGFFRYFSIQTSNESNFLSNHVHGTGSI